MDADPATLTLAASPLGAAAALPPSPGGAAAPPAPAPLGASAAAAAADAAAASASAAASAAAPAALSAASPSAAPAPAPLPLMPILRGRVVASDESHDVSKQLMVWSGQWQISEADKVRAGPRTPRAPPPCLSPSAAQLRR